MSARRSPGSTLVRSSLLALAIPSILAGCVDAERVAGTLTELRITLANALGCSTSWANPVSGDWTVAANWTNGVPTSAKDACITADGDYVVRLNGSQFARNLTVGATNGTPVLAIEGQQGSFTGTQLPAVLTVSDDVENSGTIRLTSGGVIGRGSTLDVNNGKVHNLPAGRIEVVQGVGGGRTLSTSILNEGAIDIQVDANFDARFNPAAALLSNKGTFVVAAGRTAALVQAYNFVLDGGTLTLHGTFSQAAGSFTLNSGEISGTPMILSNTQLNVAGPSQGNASFRMQGNNTFVGDVYEGQKLTIEGRVPSSSGAAVPASVVAAQGLDNAGIIELTASGFTGTGATFTVQAGAITNRPGGVIRAFQGSGGSRTIQSDLVNDGTMDVQANFSFPKQGAAFTNNGNFTLAAMRSFTVTNATVRQLGGTLTLDGTYTQSLGAFHMEGGIITGIPNISNTALRLGANSTAQGTVRIVAFSAMSGNVQQGQTILIEGRKPASTGTATSATMRIESNATNAGNIRLLSTGFPTSGNATLATAAGVSLTNLPGGRIETLAGSGGGRTIHSNITNEGTMDFGVVTTFGSGTLRNIAPASIVGDGTLRLDTEGIFFGTGSIDVNVLNVAGRFNVGASPGLLTIDGTYSQGGNGTFVVEFGGTTAGTDFDQLTVTGSVSLAGTLQLVVPTGVCASGDYEVMKFASRNGDFGIKSGLVIGGGRIVTTVPGATNYRLSVSGAPCVAPDDTPPDIEATVSGTLGDDGWYTSDVTVSWTVTDEESEISSSNGCGESTVTSDNAGITFTCSATSAGGTSDQSVTIKRDATPPEVSASRAPAANAFGWNNEDVTATYTAADGMSGLAGTGIATQLFASEGADQEGSHAFTDAAGNSATASVSGISIDRTPPEVSVSREPAAGPTGWNDTEVVVTYAATDALSGFVTDGQTTQTARFVQLFSENGANQGGSHTFTDRADNSATGSITGINIDRTPLAPVCSVTPNEIWPPNNKMVQVSVTIGGSGVASFVLRSVTNNETGAADADGFAIGTADLEGRVRASRNGGGNGRTYTLAYDVFSRGGTPGSCSVEVRVPHDQRKGG